MKKNGSAQYLNVFLSTHGGEELYTTLPSRELGDPPPSLGLGVEESSLVKRSPRPGLDGPNPGLDGPNPGLDGRDPGLDGPNPGLDGRDPGLEGPPGLMDDSPPLSTVLAGRTKSEIFI